MIGCSLRSLLPILQGISAVVPRGGKERSVRRKVRVSILAVVLVSMAVLGILAGASSAAAQEYGESVGDLIVGYHLTVSGDGFRADSEVRIELVKNDTGDTTDLGAVATDHGGALAASVALPEGLEPGTYVLTATGVTADGLTRMLSIELQSPFSGASPATGAPSGSRPALTTGLSVLALALAGGGWWWLSAAGKRRKAERADLEGRADHGLFPDGQPPATQDRPVLRRDPHLAHLAAQADWIPRPEDIGSAAQPGRSEQEMNP